MPRLELTPEQAATIRELWNTGARRDDIAAAAGLTIDSLIAAKRMLGLPRLAPSGRGKVAADPRPDEIRAACQEIRQRWSVEEHAIRAGFQPLGTEESEAMRRWKIIPIDRIVAAWDD